MLDKNEIQETLTILDSLKVDTEYLSKNKEPYLLSLSDLNDIDHNILNKKYYDILTKIKQHQTSLSIVSNLLFDNNQIKFDNYPDKRILKNSSQNLKNYNIIKLLETDNSKKYRTNKYSVDIEKFREYNKNVLDKINYSLLIIKYILYLEKSEFKVIYGEDMFNRITNSFWKLRETEKKKNKD